MKRGRQKGVYGKFPIQLLRGYFGLNEILHFKYFGYHMFGIFIQEVILVLNKHARHQLTLAYVFFNIP